MPMFAQFIHPRLLERQCVLYEMTTKRSQRSVGQTRQRFGGIAQEEQGAATSTRRTGSSRGQREAS